MPKPEEFQPMMSLEPARRRLIVQRLHGSFYDQPEPSEQLAIAVHAALSEPGNGFPLPN